MPIFNFQKLTLNKVLILVTIISTLYGIVMQTVSCNLSDKAKTYQNNYTVEVSKIKSYKDANGNLVSEKNNLLLTIDDLRNSNDSVIKQLLLQLDYSKLKLRKLEGATYIKSDAGYNFNVKSNKSDITLWTDSVRIDSIKLETFKYSNKWIEFDLSKRSDMDSANVKIKTYSELMIYYSWYKEGKWRFRNIFSPRKKNLKTDVVDLNPNTIIRDIKAINVSK